MTIEKRTNNKIKKIFALLTLHILSYFFSIIRIFYFKIYKKKSKNVISKKEKKYSRKRAPLGDLGVKW